VRLNNWITNNMTQGVFMRTASLPAANKSGPVQVAGDNSKKVVSPEDKHFRVGRDKVGGSQIVGEPR
jgi:hypothetical protein